MPRINSLSATAFIATAIALWMNSAVPAVADDRKTLNERYPDRTPGYVEEVLARGDGAKLSDNAEIETSDVSEPTRPRTQISGHRFKGLKPTTPEAKARAAAFLEKNPIERVRIELNLTPGTVGFLIRF